MIRLAVLAACVLPPLFLRGPLAWEIPCYAAFLGLLAASRSLRQLLAQLGTAHRMFLLAFLAVILAAHLYRQETKTYPAVSWSMFTRVVEGDPDYFEYAGVLADGTQVELQPEDDLFGQVFGQNLIVRLGRIARTIATPEAQQRQPELVRRYDRLVQALGYKHNQTVPQRIVLEVRVYRCSVSVRDDRSRASIERVLFRTVPLS